MTETIAVSTSSDRLRRHPAAGCSALPAWQSQRVSLPAKIPRLVRTVQAGDSRAPSAAVLARRTSQTRRISRGLTAIKQPLEVHVLQGGSHSTP